MVRHARTEKTYLVDPLDLITALKHLPLDAELKTLVVFPDNGNSEGYWAYFTYLQKPQDSAP